MFTSGADNDESVDENRVFVHSDFPFSVGFGLVLGEVRTSYDTLGSTVTMYCSDC